jgi:hypothetical protein
MPQLAQVPHRFPRIPPLRRLPQLQGSQRRRRSRLPGALLLIAATLVLSASAAASGSTAAPAPAATAAACVTATTTTTTAALVPASRACPVQLGMALPSTSPASVAAQESASGRPLAIVHTYHRWLDVFPTPNELTLATSGHLLFINWEPTSARGAPMSWSAIAAGKQDAVIDAAAQRLQGLPSVLLSFSHEPENDFGEHGSVADFVAAFRHVHDRMQADGATNVKFVWDVEGLSNPVWLNSYRALYPGAAYVDWIAWDPYNWAGCRDEGWQSFAQITRPFYSWLMAHGFGDKPFMLGEFGTVERPGAPAAKAAWIAAIPAALATMPNLRAVVYFDIGAPPANCDWQLSTSAAALHAFDQLASTGAFRSGAPGPSVNS